MPFNLRNKAGATGQMSGGHWAVFLTLAQSYGWKPRGTKAPPGFPAGEKWGGRYDTSEGQTVTAQDAKQFATVLHAASVSDTLPVALGEVIAHVEKQLEAAGIAIPDPMRMAPEHFYEEFNPLLTFLYDGEFVID
jgi:hypothetical protein